MTNLDHALAYAKRGWPVFPVSITKHPRISKADGGQGYKDATVDEVKIAEWWTRWPTTGIGLATGKRAGFFALDIDPDKGGRISLESLEFQHGILPDTLTVSTGGGGEHRYFVFPGDREITIGSNIAPGLDYRGDGGYVVAPPSRHESGNSYKWLSFDDAEIAEAPEWLLELVSKKRAQHVERTSDGLPKGVKNPPAYAKAALAGACNEIRNAGPGDKNTLLNTCAFKMREMINAGWIRRQDVADALQLAAEERDGRSQKPEGSTALRKTIESGLKGAADPTQAPAVETASEEATVLKSGANMAVAEHVLKSHRDSEGRLLIRRWRNDWWTWRGGCYRAIDSEELEAKMWPMLSRVYVPGGGDNPPKPFNPSTSKIANVMHAMMGHGTMVDSEVEPPVWIGGAEPERGSFSVMKNGLLDLRTEKLRPSTPDLFATNAIDTPWQADAPEPIVWLRFLSSVFGDDPQAIALLQEWFGYCLTSDTSQQKILFVVGPKRCGKGTIARILTALLGRASVAGPTLASLAESFGLEPLLSKAVAIVADARLSGKVDQGTIVERLLSISGEDNLTINRKNKSQITARLIARLLILSNEIPRLMDASGALPSRMLVLQIRRSFYGQEDKRLESKLLVELGGILRWAVKGWQLLTERGHFEATASAEETMRDMEEIASPVMAFVEDKCERGPTEDIECTTLYREYCDHSKEQGLLPMSLQLFSRALKTAFPDVQTVRVQVGGARQRRFTGIDVRRANG